MIIKDFSNIRIIVLGDIILDGYYTGNIKRISPEAPVPVVNVENVKFTPGGAANVCNNINKLGANSFLLGFCGDDQNGNILKNVLKEENIENFVVNTDLKTITKIRIVAENGQQIARLDFEDNHLTKIKNFETNFYLNENINCNDFKDNYDFNKKYEIIKNKFLEIVDHYDGVIISDYNKGVCSYNLCKEIIKISKEKKKFVLVDPKIKNWEKYDGATIIKPNLKELCDAFGENIPNDDESIEKAAFKLFQNYNFENIVVTRSSKGISLVNKKGVKHFKALAKEVYDVSGAGDTVSASLAVYFLSGENIEDSIKFANTCASIVVQKAGTVPITLFDLYEYHYYDNDEKIIKEKEKKDLILNFLKYKNYNILYFDFEKIFNIKHKSDFNFENLYNLNLIKEKKQENSLNFTILTVKKEIFNNFKDYFKFLSYIDFIDFIFID